MFVLLLFFVIISNLILCWNGCTHVKPASIILRTCLFLVISTVGRGLFEFNYKKISCFLLLFIKSCETHCNSTLKYIKLYTIAMHLYFQHFIVDGSKSMLLRHIHVSQYTNTMFSPKVAPITLMFWEGPLLCRKMKFFFFFLIFRRLSSIFRARFNIPIHVVVAIC